MRKPHYYIIEFRAGSLVAWHTDVASQHCLSAADGAAPAGRGAISGMAISDTTMSGNCGRSDVASSSAHLANSEPCAR